MECPPFPTGLAEQEMMALHGLKKMQVGIGNEERTPGSTSEASYSTEEYRRMRSRTRLRVIVYV
jgi:hypothetical protein